MATHRFIADVIPHRPPGTFGSACRHCGEGIYHPNHDIEYADEAAPTPALVTPPLGERAPKRGMRLAPCTGAAHSNPHTDFCALCAPRWGWLEVPETEEPCRTVILRPYRKGMGPWFTLRIWDGYDWAGQPLSALGGYPSGKYRVRYMLTQHTAGKATILFAGDDITLSSGTTTDSDKAVAQVMGWLCLTEDSGSDITDSYTAEQRRFSEEHADVLQCEVTARFDPEAQY